MEKEKTEDQTNSQIEDNPPKEEKNEAELKAKQENREELAPEAKIVELEEKLVRQYAEMENQRRRYEKERDDAFE